MVIIALAATMLADLVAAIFELQNYGVLSDLDDGKDLTYETVDAMDKKVIAGYGVQIAAYSVAAIAFLAWFHRVYRNLPRLGTWPVRYDFGWAVGSWLIPIFNFVRPKQMVDDAWRGSEPVPGHKRLEDHPKVPLLLHVWWAAWLLGSLLGNFQMAIGGQVQTLPEQKSASILSMVTTASWFIGAALAIVVVLRITRRQERAIAVTLHAGPPFPAAQHAWGQPGTAHGWGQPVGAWGYPPVWGQPAPSMQPGLRVPTAPLNAPHLGRPSQPAGPPPPTVWGQPAAWGQPTPPPQGPPQPGPPPPPPTPQRTPD